MCRVCFIYLLVIRFRKIHHCNGDIEINANYIIFSGKIIHIDNGEVLYCRWGILHLKQEYLLPFRQGVAFGNTNPLRNKLGRMEKRQCFNRLP